VTLVSRKFKVESMTASTLIIKIKGSMETESLCYRFEATDTRTMTDMFTRLRIFPIFSIQRHGTSAFTRQKLIVYCGVLVRAAFYLFAVQVQPQRAIIDLFNLHVESRCTLGALQMHHEEET
jgi:hypothetical protein